jgi:hypothetical protein
MEHRTTDCGFFAPLVPDTRPANPCPPACVGVLDRSELPLGRVRGFCKLVDRFKERRCLSSEEPLGSEVRDGGYRAGKFIP